MHGEKSKKRNSRNASGCFPNNSRDSDAAANQMILDGCHCHRHGANGASGFERNKEIIVNLILGYVISMIRNTSLAAVAGVVTVGSVLSAAIAGEVYVPLGSAGEIVVIDSTRDEITGKIKGIPAVHGLAGTRDGRFLIAGSYAERESGSGAPAKPSGVTEDEHASHHALPSPERKKPSGAISTVTVVRTSDRSAIRRIDVFGVVHHVAVSPDGRMAVVTHPDEDGISAIDLSSYRVVAEVATGPLPNYAAFSPDGSRVYVSNAGNETVSVVDAKRWSTVKKIVVGNSPEHVVMSKDGSMLYVNNVDDGTVSIISTESATVVNTIPAGSTPHGIDLSDDGRTLFVAALEDGKLVAVNLATGSSRTVPLSPEPYHLMTVRGMGKLYVSSATHGKIWVVDQTSLAVLRTIDIPGKGHQMVQAAGT